MTVFILAYDFPPEPITASQRPYAWARYLNQFGITPVVITKNWNQKIYQTVEVEIFENYTVHYLDVNHTLISKFLYAHTTLGRIQRKIASFLNLFLHASFYIGPYNEFYKYSKSLIDKTEGDKILLVTAMPFGMFKIGYLLHKKTEINWIADYRDDWTTTEIPIYGFINKILYKTLYKYQEKKWVGNALFITSVSQHYVNKILQLLHRDKKDGIVIENGYFEEEHQEKHVGSKTENLLRFVYVGSLYTSQDIDQILRCIHIAINNRKKFDRSIKFIFLGTIFSSNKKKQLKTNYENSTFQLVFHERLPKKDAINVQNECDFAIICPHKNLKGIPSSKLYEFIGSRMPVIFYPNDQDIVYETLTKCNLGVTAEDEEELISLFERIIEDKNAVQLKGNDFCENFTRRFGSKLLAEQIKKIKL